MHPPGFMGTPFPRRGKWGLSVIVCALDSGQRRGQVAELSNLRDTVVAGLVSRPLVGRIGRDHARGRAGKDDVAGLESHIGGDIAYQLLAVEDQVRRVRALPLFAIDRERNRELVAIDEVRSYEPGADHAGAIERL